MKVALTFLSSLLITCEKQTALPDTAARHSGNSSAVYMEHSCILELKQTLQSMCFSITLLLAYLKCILEAQKKSGRETPERRGSILAKLPSLSFYWQCFAGLSPDTLPTAHTRSGVSLCLAMPITWKMPIKVHKGFKNLTLRFDPAFSTCLKFPL